MSNWEAFTTSPGGGCVFVANGRLTALASIVLIDDFEMTAPWDELPFEMGDPESFLDHRDIVAGLYSERPTFLNPWLTGERPLRRGRRQGIIVARGQHSVPSQYAEHSQVPIEFSIWDERGTEFPFAFRARVSRVLKVEYERRERQRRTRRIREPIFERDSCGEVVLRPATDSCAACCIGCERSRPGECHSS